MEINNKVVVITGAAEGIGFETADVFVKKGAKVVLILDVNEELGVAAADKLNTKYGNNKAVFIKCDVTTDLEAVSKNILNTYKRVDVLVNNAGIADETRFNTVIAINLTAVVAWSLKFYEHMSKSQGGEGGTIINLGSIYSYEIQPLAPIYSTTKFGVRGFTRTLGHTDNYNKSGVRVVAVCPGFTSTKLIKRAIISESEEVLKEFNGVMEEVVWQTADAVGRAIGEVYESAESGTIWEIVGDGPIKEFFE